MKKRFFELIEKIRNSDREFKDEDLSELESGMLSIINYIDSVYTGVTHSVILSPQETDEVEELEYDCANKYSRIVISCGIINRICESYNVEPLFPEKNDIKEIGDFCFKAMAEFYLSEIRR